MSRRLILMRHAKSDWAAGEPDHARPLNARGRRSARAIGDWLRLRGHRPDLVLCSSAARTRETLDLLGLDAPTRFEDILYHAEPHTVLRALHHAEGGSVLLIGHNPGLQAVAARIVAEPPAHPDFARYPTAATLVADLPVAAWSDLGWSSGTVRDFTVPRDLI
ncbi:SixA phosphatase family protein [Roseivivax sp. CAU 1761]